MLLGHALYMLKSSQMMLDKFLFNWSYPNSIMYIIISDPIISCVIIYPSQHAHLCYT
uniref:Uncharacterized protein n=1 Tax=Arundo donax TaxID=35708 RepID=A0A0A9AQA1_ARUDO